MTTQQILHWLHNLYKGTESAVKTEEEGSTCPIRLVLNQAGLSKKKPADKSALTWMCETK